MAIDLPLPLAWHVQGKDGSALSRLSRRSFVSGAAALAVTLTACDRRRAWAQHQFYKYHVRLAVDGRPYDLTNGGVLATDPHNIQGTGFHDLPMPSVASMPTGETLVVFPPRLGRAWSNAGLRLGGRRLEKLPYGDGAYPSVFIFDDASKPNRVSGWMTRSGVMSGKTRIKLVSVENNIVADDARVSVSRRLPWYAATERAYQIHTNEAVRYRQENLSLFEEGSHSYAPARALFMGGSGFQEGRRRNAS